MAENLQKRPSKGILKNSSSFDKQDSHAQPRKSLKETKWDEMNIIATLHPADKDYGHMKIDEPKTPYNYVDPDEVDGLDPVELEERIRMRSDQPPRAFQSQSDDDEDNESDDEDQDLTPEERAKKREFEMKRKKHYNEFYAVKLARKLLEEEEEDDDDDDNNDEYNAATSSTASSKYNLPN